MSKPPFTKVLIANRGEIAVRIARTLREMGIISVAVYSDADRDARHVAACDQAVHIGPAIPLQSYLNQDRILEAARASGAEAIHPGYGFLSENAIFARQCAASGLVFIGPPPGAIEAMGSKIESRRAAMAASVPIVPGTDYPLDDPGAIAAVADELGFPIVIKASAGGGGYGMKIVNCAEDIQTTLEAVQRDAQRAFGDTTVYIEKFFSPAPRHVEIQVLGDHFGNLVHLGERECSVQRRFQKIVEETPSLALTPELRARMGAAAVSLAKEMGYFNAGTVECLVDGDGNFYFLEMNTRLQVEHPVTEEVTGVDLVREMIRIASGGALAFSDTPSPAGHAIEARIYAEDPAKRFMPSPGRITRYEEPTGDGIRVDSGFAAGDAISVYYDPLVAKLIVSGDNRGEALARMREAVAAFKIEGVNTNLPFLAALFASDDFVAGRMHTRYVDQHLSTLMENIPG